MDKWLEVKAFVSLVINWRGLFKKRTVEMVHLGIILSATEWGALTDSGKEAKAKRGKWEKKKMTLLFSGYHIYCYPCSLNLK